jgi:hypothetical protein
MRGSSNSEGLAQLRLRDLVAALERLEPGAAGA